MTKTVSGTTTIEAQYGYDPYGKATKLQGSQEADFQYAGYYMHARSGLNMPVFRQYNSALGRWLSRDPLGEVEGTNLFAYVGNCPTSFIDLLGLQYYGAFPDFWERDMEARTGEAGPRLVDVDYTGAIGGSWTTAPRNTRTLGAHGRSGDMDLYKSPTPWGPFTPLSDAEKSAIDGSPLVVHKACQSVDEAADYAKSKKKWVLGYFGDISSYDPAYPFRHPRAALFDPNGRRIAVYAWPMSQSDWDQANAYARGAKMPK